MPRSLSLDIPWWGTGAPAAYFMPRAAEMLSAKVIIPEDGDVANGLGAVTSHVLVWQTWRFDRIVREGMLLKE